MNRMVHPGSFLQACSTKAIGLLLPCNAPKSFCSFYVSEEPFGLKFGPRHFFACQFGIASTFTAFRFGAGGMGEQRAQNQDIFVDIERELSCVGFSSGNAVQVNEVLRKTLL